MDNIFRAYDIRGVYPENINENVAYDIGRAFVKLLGCNKIVVGRDMRLSSASIYQSLVKGIIDSGCDVYNIGIVSTPICYFANSHFEADGSIMITGSHHSKEYNGFKLCGKNTIPISQISGLVEMKRIFDDKDFIEPERAGIVYDRNIDNDYYTSMFSYLKLKPMQKMKIVCDYANGIGVVETYGLKSKVEIIPLYDKIDGNFPNHDPNPSIKSNLKELGKKVREKDADFGAGFDGDADRIVFVDENGTPIPSDLITALISQELIEKYGPITIIYDPISSKIIKELVEKKGATAIRSKVGHSFIKHSMRNNNAVFGGELAGHYYFKDNNYSESSLLALIYVLNIVAKGDKPLSYYIHEIKKYSKNEEVHLEIDDSARVLEKLEVFYYKGIPDKLDGLTLDFGDWWFNIRASNTEHLIRLNIEAKTPELLKEKKYELLKTIEKITAHEI